MLPPEDRCLLKKIDDAVQDALSDVAESETDRYRVALLSFHDNCVFNAGNSRLRQAQAAPRAGGVAVAEPAGGGGHGEEAEVHDQKAAWPILIAQNIAKVSPKLQTEMLGSKLLSYFTEWCSTPSCRAAGVAYTDCVIRYDVDGQFVVFESERKPEHNIYLGIRSNLLSGVDPVLDDVAKRVQKIYSQTFWSIPEAFTFGQAAQAGGASSNCQREHTRNPALRVSIVSTVSSGGCVANLGVASSHSGCLVSLLAPIGLGEARPEHRYNHGVLGVWRRRLEPLYIAPGRHVRR